MQAKAATATQERACTCGCARLCQAERGQCTARGWMAPHGGCPVSRVLPCTLHPLPYTRCPAPCALPLCPALRRMRRRDVAEGRGQSPMPPPLSLLSGINQHGSFGTSRNGQSLDSWPRDVNCKDIELQFIVDMVPARPLQRCDV